MESKSGPAETVRRLEAGIQARGMTLFARIDHARGAAEAGIALPPTDLLIFGSARAGTPLMQAGRSSGIDLPLKVLVWQEASGRTLIGYNDPAWIARRHGLAGSDAVLAAMARGLESLAADAAR
ncbi:MAG TPA: DUF302 domain-containing protein [Opitutaceae bacterium]|nr:DUF302 domain-containing protein [Opitutaceae bacterium]